MKSAPHHPVRLLCTLLLFLGLSEPAEAALVIRTYTFSDLDLTPPDGNASGAVDVRNITSDILLITDLDVRLTFATDGPGTSYNGDYYVYLQHGNELSVLLNRVGRRADNEDPSAAFGYGDNGFEVTLDDQAVNGDIHSYRLALSDPPSHTTPIDPTYTVGLSGTWQPDGRNTNPTQVLDTDVRTAPLSMFHGMSAGGEWRLFLADLNHEGVARLTSWELSMTGQTSVPEPWEATLLTTLALVGLGLWRHRDLGREA